MRVLGEGRERLIRLIVVSVLALWDRSSGAGLVVRSADGWRGVGRRRNMGLGWRSLHLGPDGGGTPDALMETYERSIRAYQALTLSPLLMTETSCVHRQCGSNQYIVHH